MSDPSPAARWSLVGFWLGVGLLLALAVIQITAYAIQPRLELFPGPLDNLLAAGLAVIVIGCLVLRVNVAVQRSQREILARIEALEASQNGKVLDLGARIAGKIGRD